MNSEKTVSLTDMYMLRMNYPQNSSKHRFRDIVRNVLPWNVSAKAAPSS